VLLNERRLAVTTVEHGLQLDPEHKGLLELKKEIGSRRRPVLAFLGRDNPLNVFLGRLRHSLGTSKS